jgi:hypothetical protein
MVNVDRNQVCSPSAVRISSTGGLLLPCISNEEIAVWNLYDSAGRKGEERSTTNTTLLATGVLNE